MTAWQDEPPLTRRQMRMREREGASAPASEDEAPVASVVEAAPAPSEAAQEPSSTPPPARPSAALFAPAAAAPPATEHQLTRRELRALREHSGAASADAQIVQRELRPEVRQQAEPAPLPVETISADFAQIIATPSIDTTAIPIIPSFPVTDHATPDEPAQNRADQALPSETTPEQAAVASLPDAVEHTYTPPFGHWSMQAKIDDENQTLDHSVRRDLSSSSGAITTSALVLPSIPQAGDITRPISNTGEILITGSVELPSSLGSTGSYPTRFDRSDVDAIIAADDREDSEAGSAPVRAIRAVSSNNDAPALLAETRATESRTPFVLAIIAGSTLVVAVGLVIAGFIFNVF
ncbi:MAG: hypothetical protein ABI065_06380 [Terrimesophilobacter sp.]